MGHKCVVANWVVPLELRRDYQPPFEVLAYCTTLVRLFMSFPSFYSDGVLLNLFSWLFVFRDISAFSLLTGPSRVCHLPTQTILDHRRSSTVFSGHYILPEVIVIGGCPPSICHTSTILWESAADVRSFLP